MVKTLGVDRGGDTVGTIARIVSGTGKEAVSVEDGEQDTRIEESEADGTEKGSKVANQGSKAGRDEEGEDTESVLDKDGNIDS